MFERGFKTWCENVASQQRRELGLRASDPLDPWQLAKHLGVSVWKPEDIPGLAPTHLKTLLLDDSDSWSAVTISLTERQVIIINTAHYGGRQASDLTHELAHLLLGHKPARIDVSADGLLMLNTYDKGQEDEASWLGGTLLLPREVLLSIRKQRMELKAAAKKYGVSMDMLTYRLNVTGVNYQLSLARR